MSSSFIVDGLSEGVLVAERDRTTVVALDVAEDPAVERAVHDLCRDLAAVCGAQARLAETGDDPVLIVGTIGTSAAVDDAIARGDLDVAAIRDPEGRLRWEGFVIQAGPGVVYIAGADRRGTIYGIYDLCEAMGVSPWYWWGDVPVRAREHVVVARDAARADWPSVRYRGIFLNDEEELEAWARAHTSDDTIGPETYRRVFELLLRLKGNYLWPAMHVNAFNHDPANGRLAHAMGVVIGTSHCDMLLRSNEHEFEPWAAARAEQVAYDYSIPGRNRELLLDYWRGSIDQNRDYDVTWTVGMRGIHDYGFSTAAIDADDALDEAEKTAARVALLEQVITDQRALLTDALGDRGAEAPQIFIPYKEVLPLYDAGLRVPDDVTIVWANDNFGYVRRLPTARELERAGGHGLYYHSSYWSQPPRSYLATSSTPLALMRHELSKAWSRGVRRLWVDNVGGLKPLEIETEFFLRSAWEAGKESTTSDVVEFVRRWADTTFSGGLGDRIATLYATYYRLANQRKIEHLAANAFAQSGYGDEASRRVDALHDLFEEVVAIQEALPTDERDAFFQLVGIKIHLAYLVSAQFAYADRSTHAFDQGKAAAADHHLALSRVLDQHKRAAIHHYNHSMSGGRWSGIFTPEQFPPPVMALYPAAKPALSTGAAGLGVLVWGDDLPSERPRLELWPHGLDAKWIDVFTTGSAGLKFEVVADEWIDVAPSSGVVESETRLTVRLADPHRRGASGTIVVRNLADDTEISVEVAVPSTPAAAPDFAGWLEADGHVTIDPARPDRRGDRASTTWTTVPHLGRDLDDAVVSVGDSRTAVETRRPGAVLEYDLHLVTAGAHVLELYRLPTLDSTGRIRVAVSVDQHPSVVVESATTDEFRGDWTSAVLDNVERLRTRLPFLTAGEHTLRIHAVDPDVVLSKLVVHTRPRRPGNLGPQLSRHTRMAGRDRPDPSPSELDVAELAHVARTIYRTDAGSVPLPPVVYSGPGFWASDTTFKRNHTVEQVALAAPRSYVSPDGTKDVLATLAGGAVVEQDGVIALEAEYALVGDPGAWSTSSLDAVPVAWSHTQAETDGGTGLAMHVAERGLRWDDPVSAPGLHFALDVARAGTYHAWLLVKFDDRDDDSCWLAVDGAVQPVAAQHAGGDLYSFGTQQIWLWTALSDLELPAGRRVLSVLARKSGLRIDRIYLTTGDQLPPADAAWTPSPRSLSRADEGAPAEQ